MSSRKKITAVICLLTLMLGLFLVQPAHAQVVQVCDVDGNGGIDRIDITQIFMARNTPASGPDDPPPDVPGDLSSCVGGSPSRTRECLQV